jgi:hypothetical protein
MMLRSPSTVPKEAKPEVAEPGERVEGLAEPVAHEVVESVQLCDRHIVTADGVDISLVPASPTIEIASDRTSPGATPLAVRLLKVVDQ